MVGFLGVEVTPLGRAVSLPFSFEVGVYADLASCDCREDEEGEGERVEGARWALGALPCPSIFQLWLLVKVDYCREIAHPTTPRYCFKKEWRKVE